MPAWLRGRIWPCEHARTLTECETHTCSPRWQLPGPGWTRVSPGACFGCRPTPSCVCEGTAVPADGGRPTKGAVGGRRPVQTQWGLFSDTPAPHCLWGARSVVLAPVPGINPLAATHMPPPSAEPGTDPHGFRPGWHTATPPWPREGPCLCPASTRPGPRTAPGVRLPRAVTLWAGGRRAVGGRG